MKGFAPILIIVAIAVVIGGGSYFVVKREAIKDFFEKGDRPTQTQFTTTIDSNLNLVDDRDLIGLKVYNPAQDYVVGDANISAGASGSTGSSGSSVSTQFIGTVYTGASQGEVKRYCSEGLYLALDSGLKMNAQQTLLLLRDKNGVMIADQRYVGKRVSIVGTYPDENQMRCEALICGCEEYLTVETITEL